MPENVKPDPEKNRRSRSIGSFLLVLLVVLLVLAVVGNDPFGSPDKLSQDQYEWSLNKGDVIVQTFKGTEQGTNLIEGKYHKPGQGETAFEVAYASLDDLQERFRELKSIREYVTIAPQTLLEGIAEGVYEPVAARSLTASKEEPRPEAVGEEPVLTSPRSRIEREERLFVTVITKGKRARDGGASLLFVLRSRRRRPLLRETG